MKRLSTALALSAVLLLTSLAYGQQSGSQQTTGAAAGGSTQMQGDKTTLPPLIAALKLSESQKRKLEAVYEDRDKQLAALKQDTSLSEDARKARLNQINQNINETLTKVLTQKQKKRIVELRQNPGSRTS
ncbi:MAG: hypothetical protein U0Z53_04345 [Blastocatellia bacterium]